jgi:hypothetical protein
MKRNYLQNKENLTGGMKREMTTRSFKDNIDHLDIKRRWRITAIDMPALY